MQCYKRLFEFVFCGGSNYWHGFILNIWFLAWFMLIHEVYQWKSTFSVEIQHVFLCACEKSNYRHFCLHLLFMTLCDPVKISESEKRRIFFGILKNAEYFLEKPKTQNLRIFFGKVKNAEYFFEKLRFWKTPNIFRKLIKKIKKELTR